MGARQLVIDIPERVLPAEKTDAVAFAVELRMLAAVKLYELGRLSSGNAADLAGISRVSFLSALGRYKVFPLLDELNDLEAIRLQNVQVSPPGDGAPKAAASLDDATSLRPNTAPLAGSVLFMGDVESRVVDMDVEAAALQLPRAERAQLALKLLQSLDVLTKGEHEKIWGEEAARRDAELDTDPSLEQAAEDVFREVRAAVAR